MFSEQGKDSVFGDSVLTFQQEGTPALTRAGSPLSSLSLPNEKSKTDFLAREQTGTDGFGDDEIKNFGVEGTPGLTRTGSFSSLCPDDEEVSPPVCILCLGYIMYAPFYINYVIIAFVCSSNLYENVSLTRSREAKS